jgi:hypothetical protein
MSDLDLNHDLQKTARQVAALSRQIHTDPQHKARLREELLRRHQELTADHTQRAAWKLWPRLAGLKRLTLVAPPALAAAVAALAVVWGLQISGHPAAQPADAAHLTRALARTMPTVTSWKVSLHELRGNAATSYECTRPLKPGQRLYIRGDRTYLYSQGKWFQLTSSLSDPQCPAEYQWVFLPARLAHNHPTLLPARTVDGRTAVGIRYVMSQTADARVVATAWTDPHSGLVIRMARVVVHNGQVVERETADYHYTKSGS